MRSIETGESSEVAEKKMVEESKDTGGEEKTEFKNINDKFEELLPIIEDQETLRRMEDLKALYGKYYPEETLPDDPIKKLEEINRGLKKIGEERILIDLLVEIEKRQGYLERLGKTSEQRKKELKKLGKFALIAIIANLSDELSP